MFAAELLQAMCEDELVEPVEVSFKETDSTEFVDETDTKDLFKQDSDGFPPPARCNTKFTDCVEADYM